MKHSPKHLRLASASHPEQALPNPLLPSIASFQSFAAKETTVSPASAPATRQHQPQKFHRSDAGSAHAAGATEKHNNMKTKSNIHYAADAHGNGNNQPKLYEVTVYRGDYYSTKVRVKAYCTSGAEIDAAKLAQRKPISEWERTDSELYHFDFEQVQEGKGHE
jgi:hypothetical protein